MINKIKINNKIVKKHPVISFYFLSLLIGFIVTLPVFLSSYNVISIKIPSFLFLIAASSASISAIIIQGFLDGKKGILNLIKKIIFWKISLKWYTIAIFMNFIIAALALKIYTLFGHSFPNISENLNSIFIVFIILTLQAGLGEEIGWRGFATPLLQKKFNGVLSCLIIGLIWSIWHIPLYFIPQTFQNIMFKQIGILSFILYTIFLISISISYTWIYNKTKSLLMPILLHGSLNTATWFFSASKISEIGLLPLIIITILQAIFSIIIIKVSGKDLESKYN